MMPRPTLLAWTLSRFNYAVESSGSYTSATSKSLHHLLSERVSLIYRTRAIPGPPMLINDFQGVCSLPEPVDDDFITSQGMFPQPASRVSVLAGFVAIAREFQIISECFFHHRYILNTGSRTISTSWTVEAEDKLHRLLRDLPTAIQDPMTNQTEAAKQSFAMQRANILITAAIAKFALVNPFSSVLLRQDRD